MRKRTIIKMRRVIFVVTMLLPMIGVTQMIGIKSVPIATGDQFMIYPTQNYGMPGFIILPETDSISSPASAQVLLQMGS